MLSFNLEAIIRSAGYLGLFGIVFAESGLLIGFFLPGDSLLFTAGFLASQGYLHIGLLITLCSVAAIIGDSVGYAFGAKVGPKIFTRPDSLLFHHEHIERAQNFYAKHGKKTLILARFMPIIRTFAPILAGVGKMHYSTFLTYNIIGGIGWASGLSLFGYFLGRMVPSADRYILPIVAAIIVISVAPSVYHVLRDPQARSALMRAVKNFFKRGRGASD